MNEYRVKVTVRNNLLLSAIEAAGYPSAAAFARDIGFGSSNVNELISMRAAPINEIGEFSPLAKAVMEGLGAAPSDLWTTAQLNMKLIRNTVERHVSQNEVQQMLENQSASMLLPSPEDEYLEKEQAQKLQEVVETLTVREQQILAMRHHQEMTYEQVSNAFGVTRERVRQIELKALRKLRHHSRLDKIKEIYGINHETHGY
jgi:RNA polymerase sigma factor (sigma-70 family)